ncbi:hypothetical protein C8Q77DRAFT_853614 [Trametes polyzona]|nr:hypothetical protein C8Q77DRAFT_853614 [Trametes polyzona]
MAHGEMSFFSKPSSSAVKISAPPSEEPSSPRPKKDNTQRQCRNILIYGHCKFQDKGCIYYHPPRDAPSPAPPDSPTPSAALPAQAVNAPVFVPKAPVNPGSPTPVEAAPSFIQKQSSISSDSSSGQSSSQPSEQQIDSVPDSVHDQYDPYSHYSYTNQSTEAPDDAGQAPSMNPYELPSGYDAAALDPFYAPSMTYHTQPLNYHLYTLPRPEALEHRFFISDDIREELQRRSETIRAAPPTGIGLPEELQGYHSLIPLEPIAGERRKFGHWFSTLYRATNSSDGLTYVLRRVENFRLTQQAAFSAIEAWSRVRHPNIVSVHEAFTTRAFNDSSLVVVYEDHPNSQTLLEAHIKPKPPQYQNGRLQAQSNRISERTLWSYITQITSALKAAHEAGLAVRLLDASKIIVTGKNRVRLAVCGIVDVLTYTDPAPPIAEVQRDDLTLLGILILQLCNGSQSVTGNLQKSIDNVGKHYSADLQNVAIFLVKPGAHKSIRGLLDMLGGRLLAEFDEAQNAVDRLEGELMTELENARLVRLLCKFGFINERPEQNHDPRWSETGDRYIVKLFRDYVFHQVDERGRPVVNLTHVLSCLNKLDAGTDERLMLISRDQQSCLVVSYREVKACIESAFSELARG